VTGVHQLPAADFLALSTGRGGAAAVHRLASAQLSKRLLLLHALMTATRYLPAEVTAALHAGYDLAAGAQQRDSSSITEVLMYPSIGAWAAMCLRKLRGREADVQSLRSDLGHLAAIACVAAARAGLDFEIRLPTRAGTVMLPSLGMACFGEDGPDRDALVRSCGDRLELVVGRRAVTVPEDPAADGPGWRGLRRLRVGAGRNILAVTLDDLDPFRCPSDLPVTERLPAAAVTRWEQAIAGAWDILVKQHVGYADAIGAGLVSLVPLGSRSARDSMSATSAEAFGSCAVSEPKGIESLAVTLVHEFQHVKLGGLHDIVPLYVQGVDSSSYSPWRDDPRPVSGLLQGAYAYLGITDFWRIQRSLDSIAGLGNVMFAHFEFARWREQTWHAIESIEHSGCLTPTGHDLLSGMRDTIRPWRDEVVPDEPAAAARSANVDHRLSWRLRNLSPDQSEVGALAEAWLAGARPGPGRRESTVTRFDRVPARNPRLDLLCLRLQDPSRFARRYRDSPAAALGEINDADIAYANGDMYIAASYYRQLIGVDPEQKAAWIGLAVTENWPGSSMLAQCLELVYALHKRIRQLSLVSPDPVDLASWLAAAPPRRP
jgi:HEXXH motif-containing protein